MPNLKSSGKNQFDNLNYSYPARRIPSGLIGRRITGIRYLMPGESDSVFGPGMGGGTVLVLDGGKDFLIPSRDEEGNGPGALFIRESIIS